MQRNLNTGDERMAIRVGHIAGKDLMHNMRSWASSEDNLPQILQMFITPRLIKNNILKVVWTPSSIQMKKIVNKLPIFEQRYSLATRVTTLEDEEDGNFTDQQAIPNIGPVADRIYKALLEVQQHIKKCSDITLTAGTFFFKAEDTEKPVLVLASQLKTDRPILVLNPNSEVAFIQQESRLDSYEVRRSELVSLASSTQNLKTQTSNYFEKEEQKENEPFKFQSSLPPIKSRTDTKSDMNIVQVTDRQSIFTNQSGSGTKEINQRLPPKRKSSGSHAGLGLKACAFCPETKIEANLPFQMTANQVITLYEYYFKNPDEILQIASSSERQKQMLEQMYLEVNSVGSSRSIVRSDSRTSFGSQGAKGNGEKIPLPIQRAFGIVSSAKYQVARYDMSFIYQTLNLCSECYEAVKNLLINQKTSEEQKQFRPHNLPKPQVISALREPSQQDISMTMNKDFVQSQQNYPLNLLDYGGSTEGHHEAPLHQTWITGQKEVQSADDKQEEEYRLDLDSQPEKCSGHESNGGQGLRDQNDGEGGIKEEDDIDLASSVEDQEAHIQPGFNMFSKVRAGREVSQEEERQKQFEIMHAVSEQQIKSVIFDHTGERSIGDSISLNIKNNSLKGPSKSVRQERPKSKSSDINSQNELKQHIQAFQKYSNQKPQLQNLARNIAKSRRKSASAKLRLSCATANSSGFLHREKKSQFDINNSMRRRKEQLETVEDVIQHQQRLLADQQYSIESMTFDQQYNDSVRLSNMLEKESLRKAMMAKQPQSKQFSSKNRPISANPISFGYCQNINYSLNDSNSNLLQNQPSASINMHDILHPSYPSNFDVYFTPQESIEVPNKNNNLPGMYSKFDACKVYLKSVTKNDFDQLLLQKQKQKQRQNQKLSCQRLSATTPSYPGVNVEKRNTYGLPPKPSNINRQPKRQPPSFKQSDQQTYSKNIPVQRPKKSRSPIHTKRKDSARSQIGRNSQAKSQSKNQVSTAQNYQQDGDSALRASLLGLQDMKMSDMDQIAANADNLIEILQSIKQVKKQKELADGGGDFQAVETKPEQTTNQDEVTAGQEVQQNVEVRAEEDFWDSHTHSPLVQPGIVVQSSGKADNDLWGNSDDQVAIGTSDNLCSQEQQQITKTPIPANPPPDTQQETKAKKFNSVASKSKESRILKKSQNSSNKPKSTFRPKSSTRTTTGGKLSSRTRAFGKQNSDLFIDQQQSVPVTVVHTTKFPPEESHSQHTDRETSTIMKAYGAVSSTTTQKQRRQDQRGLQNSMIPAPLEAFPQDSDSRLAYHQGDDLIYSAAGATSLEAPDSTPPLPDDILERIEHIVQQRVQEELKKQDDKMIYVGNMVQQEGGTLRPKAYYSASGDLPERIFSSEAFDSAVRQKPDPRQQESIKDSDADFSRMELPELSPLIKVVDPNIQAHVQSVIDNKFLESSADNELPIPANDESYTQDYSSFQRQASPEGSRITSTIPNTVQTNDPRKRTQQKGPEDMNNHSPTIHEVPSEYQIQLPGDSPEPFQIQVLDSNIHDKIEEPTVDNQEEPKKDSHFISPEFEGQDTGPKEQNSAYKGQNDQNVKSFLVEEPLASVELTYDETFEEATFVEYKSEKKEHPISTDPKLKLIQDQLEENKRELNRISAEAVQTSKFHEQQAQVDKVSTPAASETVKVPQNALAKTEIRNHTLGAHKYVSNEPPSASNYTSYSQNFTQTIKSSIPDLATCQKNKIDESEYSSI